MLTSRLVRGLLIAGGTVSLVIGIIGIVIPLLPTTPFLLLAAACYLRGSERMHEWLLSNRWLGEYIRNYRQGRGIPARTKVVALCLLWATIGYSAIFIVSASWIRIILIIIALGVSYHILSIRTLRRDRVVRS